MIRSRKLRQSAKEAPYCFNCFRPNQFDENGVGQLLCLAHSNELRHGRGAYLKSYDIFGAIVCKQCHDAIDGRSGELSKAEKHERHRIAHDRTLLFWCDNGYLVEA